MWTASVQSASLNSTHKALLAFIAPIQSTHYWCNLATPTVQCGRRGGAWLSPCTYYLRKKIIKYIYIVLQIQP